MDEVYKFLKENPIFYVATMDGDQPRVRPFGVVALFEGKLYLQTGNVKPVFKQMMANPKIELCTMGKDGTSWLRVAAEVVLDPRIEARRQMLEENPTLRRRLLRGRRHRRSALASRTRRRPSIRSRASRA